MKSARLARATGVAALLVAACCARPGSSPDPGAHEASRGALVMGTILEVTLHGRDPQALESALREIFGLAERLETHMSRHEPESDVSRLNRSAGRAAVQVDPAVAQLLREAVDYGRLTHGAFDVTVGPLVALWTRAGAADALPTASAIAAARARVGVDRIHLEPGDRVALEAGTAIDLGGIAKGFALDRVRPLLRTHGVEAALLNFGQSSTWALGAPAGAAGWRLLAREPSGGFGGLVTLRDQALSVSGSLGQWSEIEGRRFGHVLDPRTGWPLTRRRQSLVVAPSATLAEALSTALLVLGEKEGIDLVAAQPGCQGWLVDADGRSWTTSGWSETTRFEPLAPD